MTSFGPLEWIAVGGFLLTIATNTTVVGVIYGKLVTRLDSVERELRNDGRHGLVQSGELDLLVKKADGEHRVMNSEITTLRERVHGHEKVLGEHEVRIERLEEGA